MANINPDWPRQIWAIFAQHFKDVATAAGITLTIHGQNVDTQRTQEWAEFRLAGPVFVPENVHEYRCNVTVNIMCKALMGGDDIYRLETLIGKISAGCTPGISGACLVDECFQIDRDSPNLRVTRFGQLNPTLRILVATVECDYSGYLTAAA